MKKCVVCGEIFKPYGLLGPSMNSWRGIFIDVNNGAKCKACGAMNVWAISGVSVFLFMIIGWIGCTYFYFLSINMLPDIYRKMVYDNLIALLFGWLLFGFLYIRIHCFIGYVYRYFFGKSENLSQSNNPS